MHLDRNNNNNDHDNDNNAVENETDKCNRQMNRCVYREKKLSEQGTRCYGGDTNNYIAMIGRE